MDVFIASLIGGFVILAVLLALFGNPMIAYAPVQPVYYPEVISNISDSQLVGLVETEDSEYHYIGEFDVSNLKEEKTSDLGERRIYNGLLFGSDSIKYTFFGNVRKFSIDFEVKRANGYGGLLMKMNNNVIFNEVLGLGNYSFSFNGTNETKYDIEIIPESSQWRIWAPNVYNLSNVKIKFETFITKMKDFSFPYKENFTYGKIYFKFYKKYGNFIVELNGKEIFHSDVKDLMTVEFNKIERENFLIFKADENSEFSGEARQYVFYKTLEENKFSTTFNITQEQYNKLPGYVSFDVIDVLRPGGLRIKINEFTDYDSVDERKYYFPISKQNVIVGENSLVVESIEDSLFAIKNFEIRV